MFCWVMLKAEVKEENIMKAYQLFESVLVYVVIFQLVTVDFINEINSLEV